MESNHQQAVLEMVAHSAAVFPIGPDGSVHIQHQQQQTLLAASTADGTRGDRCLRPPYVRGSFALHTYGAPSAASYSVAMTDCAMSLGEPFYAEVSDALIVFGLVGRHNY